MISDIVDDRMLGALHVRALSRAGLAHDPVVSHGVVQAGTLEALMAGRFDGDLTIGELLAHGSLGIGTTNGLGGELVVLDRSAFVVAGDGSVRQVEDRERTPFAVVCDFVPSERWSIDGPTDLAGLRAALESHESSRAAVSAVRIDGHFASVTVRSVHQQRRPYPPLVEVTAHQTEWEIRRTDGTIVGFRFPDATAGVEVPGYHLHYISGDRRSGGHVLDVQLARGEIAVEGVDDLYVELPPGVELGDPDSADRSAIRAVEGG